MSSDFEIDVKSTAHCSRVKFQYLQPDGRACVSRSQVQDGSDVRVGLYHMQELDDSASIVLVHTLLRIFGLVNTILAFMFI